jgi:hypothetical protein
MHLAGGLVSGYECLSYPLPQPSIITTEGRVCEFPFEYKGVIHHSCTDEDGNGANWCTTDTNTGAWGWCDQSSELTQLSKVHFDEVTVGICPNKMPGKHACELMAAAKYGMLVQVHEEANSTTTPAGCYTDSAGMVRYNVLVEAGDLGADCGTDGTTCLCTHSAQSPEPTLANGWEITSGNDHCHIVRDSNRWCVQDERNTLTRALTGPDDELQDENYLPETSCGFTYTGNARISTDRFVIEGDNDPDQNKGCNNDWVSVNGLKYCGGGTQGQQVGGDHGDSFDNSPENATAPTDTAASTGDKRLPTAFVVSATTSFQFYADEEKEEDTQVVGGWAHCELGPHCNSDHCDVALATCHSTETCVQMMGGICTWTTFPPIPIPGVYKQLDANRGSYSGFKLCAHAMPEFTSFGDGTTCVDSTGALASLTGSEYSTLDACKMKCVETDGCVHTHEGGRKECIGSARCKAVQWKSNHCELWGEVQQVTNDGPAGQACYHT